MTFTIINKKNELFRVLIDDVDAYEVLQHKWCIDKRKGRYYVKRSKEEHTQYLHQLIMGTPPRGFDVDHVNGDGRTNKMLGLL